MDKGKIKLFCWSDSPTANTGFGVVAQNLYKELIATGRYEIRTLGINFQSHQPNPHDFDVIQAASKGDLFGFSVLGAQVQRFDPDLVFLFQDLFNLPNAIQAVHVAAPRARVVVYFPIDTGTIPVQWVERLEGVNRVITYTNFAKSVLSRTGVDIPIEVIGHGIDRKAFCPIPEEDRMSYRRHNLRWTDEVFGVISVNRFTPRKNLRIFLQAYNLFQSGFKVCPVCARMSHWGSDHCELNQCDGFDKATEIHHGLQDARLYIHTNANEPTMGKGEMNSLLYHIHMAGPWRLAAGVGMPPVDIYQQSFTSESLNKVYNSGDLFVTTTHGEGWGLTLTESLAAGTRVVAPANTAIPEATTGGAVLVKNSGWVNYPHECGLVRPQVDVEALVRAMLSEYDKWVDNGHSKLAPEGDLLVPAWSEVAAKFDEIFQAEMEKGPDLDRFSTKRAEKLSITWKSATPDRILQITPALRALKSKWQGVTMKVSPEMVPLLSRDFDVSADDHLEPGSVPVDLDTDRPWEVYLQNTRHKPDLSLMEILELYLTASSLPYRPIYTPNNDVCSALEDKWKTWAEAHGAVSDVRVGVGLAVQVEHYWPGVGGLLGALAEKPGFTPVAIAAKKVKMLPDGVFDATDWGNNPDGALSSLSICDVYVGTDSYLIDGAAAFGIPILALMGPTGSAVRLKHYDAHRISREWPCLPCWRAGSVSCRAAAEFPHISRCLSEITLDEVMEKLAEVVARRLPTRALTIS